MNRSVIAVAIGLTVFASISEAAQFRCADPQFQTPPAFGVDKNFVIPIYSDCAITQTTLTDLKVIQSWVIQNFPKTTTIVSGPAPETFQNMPSLVLTVTDAADDGHGDTLTITSDVHVATDSSNQLIYENRSTDVKGSGDSGFLREFDVNYSIVKAPAGTPAGFQVRFAHVVHIAKPWYAPTGTFQKDAINGVSQDFVSDRDDFLKSLTAQF